MLPEDKEHEEDSDLYKTSESSDFRFQEQEDIEQERLIRRRGKLLQKHLRKEKRSRDQQD